MHELITQVKRNDKWICSMLNDIKNIDTVTYRHTDNDRE